MAEHYSRHFPLESIEIKRSGDGRTVEAYAAVFDTPTYINDEFGEYEEVIAKTAFNRTLAHGISRIAVFYHHGMTLYGTPSDLGSVPIGHPQDVRVDNKGLFTVTRFNKTDLADSVLEAIRNGDIRGYSFRGAIYQSTPNKMPRRKPGQPMPRVTRTELGLREYGPTPTPAYPDASILAVRSAEALLKLNDEQRTQLVRILSATTLPSDSVPNIATSANAESGAEDSREAHSRRQRQIRLRAEALFRGV